jgi:hypothetical protein
MNSSRWWRTLPLFLAVFLALSGLFVPAPATAATSAQNLDIIVIIDNSGSMHSNAKSKAMTGSDPYGLRYEATTMLVDLLDEKDRIGVVHFSKTARTVGDQMFRMSPEEKTSFRTQIAGMSIDYANPPANAKTIAPFGESWYVRDSAVEPAGTFYKAAFSNTKLLLDAAGTTNKRAVIFLTDGAPEDLGKDDTDITANTTAALKELGVPVFLLALKPDSDSNAKTFEAVSAGFTQANQRVIPVNSAFDIAQAMASVLTYLKPSYYLDVVTKSLKRRLSLLPMQTRGNYASKKRNHHFKEKQVLPLGGFGVTIMRNPAALMENGNSPPMLQSPMLPALSL